MDERELSGYELVAQNCASLARILEADGDEFKAVATLRNASELIGELSAEIRDLKLRIERNDAKNMGAL